MPVCLCVFCNATQNNMSSRNSKTVSSCIITILTRGTQYVISWYTWSVVKLPLCYKSAQISQITIPNGQLFKSLFIDVMVSAYYYLFSRKKLLQSAYGYRRNCVATCKQHSKLPSFSACTCWIALSSSRILLHKSARVLAYGCSVNQQLMRRDTMGMESWWKPLTVLTAISSAKNTNKPHPQGAVHKYYRSHVTHH